MEKSGKLAFHMAIQISLLLLCRHSKYRKDLSRYLKRFITESWFLPSSQISGGCTIPLFQLSVWCEKFVAARHYAVIWNQLLISNDRNRVRWVVLGLSQDGACTDLFENFSENSLKGDLPNDTTLTPPLFSLVNTFNIFIAMKPMRIPADPEHSVSNFGTWKGGSDYRVCITL